jgi:hypothetical protein
VHVKHYASSRLEAAGCAKLAKDAAAICGAIGAAVMFALTWLGTLPEVMIGREAKAPSGLVGPCGNLRRNSFADGDAPVCSYKL